MWRWLLWLELSLHRKYQSFLDEYPVKGELLELGLNPTNFMQLLEYNYRENKDI